MCAILSAAAASFASASLSLAEGIAPVCVAIAGCLVAPQGNGDEPAYGTDQWSERQRLLRKLDRPLADLCAACPQREICEVALVVRMSIVTCNAEMKQGG